MRAHVLMLVMVTTAMGYRVRLSEVLPLDMAPNSVDDAYTTCTKKMSERISDYLKSDMNANTDFKKAWNAAGKKYKNLENGLDENHAIAIRVYVSGGPYEIYSKFNAAVRTGSNIYKTVFNYKALHFLLTDALKHLKESQEQCMTTYRKTNLSFDTNVANKEVRFGSFASTSLHRDLTRFGQKSCFKIWTCHGAALGNYSHLAHEEEVLIPPYEKFLVESVEVPKEQERWCDVVYTLTSTGTLSNLDCALMQNTV